MSDKQKTSAESKKEAIKHLSSLIAQLSERGEMLPLSLTDSLSELTKSLANE